MMKHTHISSWLGQNSHHRTTQSICMSQCKCFRKHVATNYYATRNSKTVTLAFLQSSNTETQFVVTDYFYPDREVRKLLHYLNTITLTSAYTQHYLKLCTFTNSSVQVLRNFDTAPRTTTYANSTHRKMLFMLQLLTKMITVNQVLETYENVQFFRCYRRNALLFSTKTESTIYLTYPVKTTATHRCGTRAI